MEKRTIQCPRCKGILEVTNPKAEPVLLITCPNPQCGAKMRISFDTGETQLADCDWHDDQPGSLLLYGKEYPLVEGENTIGRQSKTTKSAIQLPTDNQSMSREHLRIIVHRLKSGRFKAVASDMRTEAKIQQVATLIDDEPLQPEDAVVLIHGDIITIGETRIKYI